MSDAQTPATIESADRSLLGRRLMVIVLSFVLGAIIAAGAQIVLLRVDLSVTFPLSAWEVPLIICSTIPMGFLIMIWLDYFFGTKLLPE